MGKVKELENENVKDNVKILTIEDILAKKDECKKRKEKKYAYVYSEFLGGVLKAHSLNKIDRNDVREHMREDGEKGVKYFIYISIDMLQDKVLLDKFGCTKGKELSIVDALFNEAEMAKIVDDLSKLNGWDNFSENDILMYSVDEIEGE